MSSASSAQRPTEANAFDDERASPETRPDARPDEAIPALLFDSSRELVRSLREPLHAITLDADLLASGDEARRGVAAGEPARAAARLRAQRLRRQVASISRAIEMLESALDPRPEADGQSDLVALTHDAVGFLTPFATRSRRRFALRTPPAAHLEIEVDPRSAWQTLVVVLAERLLAVPEGETLRVDVVPRASDGSGAGGGRDATDAARPGDAGPAAAHEVRLSGAFLGLGQGGERCPSSLTRLLDSGPLARCGARVRVCSSIEVALSFAAGRLDSERPGRSGGDEWTLRAVDAPRPLPTLGRIAPGPAEAPPDDR